MPTPQAQVIQSEFQDVVQSLEALNRDHEQAYRLGVGRLILQRFFAGQAAQYHDRNHGKDNKFAQFLAQHGEEIAALELSETWLRRCVRVTICLDSLAPLIRPKLGWSAALAISTLAEPNLRARLAAAAVREHWTVAQVKAAVEQARDHRVWDADPSTPELELPPPAAPAKPQPGRLVTRTEKWSEEIGAWQEEFAQIDAGKLSRAQIERMRASVAKVRVQLDALDAALEN